MAWRVSGLIVQGLGLSSFLHGLSMTNALDMWIKVRHVRLDNPFEDWRPEGAAIMLELFKRIHQRAFPPINFLSKSE